MDIEVFKMNGWLRMNGFGLNIFISHKMMFSREELKIDKLLRARKSVMLHKD